MTIEYGETQCAACGAGLGGELGDPGENLEWCCGDCIDDFVDAMLVQPNGEPWGGEDD